MSRKRTHEFRAALAEDREARRLQAEIEALKAKAEADRAADDAAEDAEIAAMFEAEEAEAAELQRRAIEEPPGSLRHAAREARRRGLDHLPVDLLEGLDRDAYAELQHPMGPYRELWAASVSASGTEILRAKVGA